MGRLLLTMLVIGISAYPAFAEVEEPTYYTDATLKWGCTMSGGTAVVKVSFDAITRVLSVEDETGMIDEGFAIRRTYKDQPYTEWYLPNDTSNAAYYLRVNNTRPDLADFRHCWSCQIFNCKLN
jgi:hypothetical protein